MRGGKNGPRDSEIDADLCAEDEGVGDLAGATGADDVLEVGLDEERAVEEEHSVGEFEGGLEGLGREGRAGLGGGEVVAEMAIDDGEAGGILGTAGNEAKGGDAAGEEPGQLAEGLVGRGEEGAEDAEAGLVPGTPKR